MYILSLFYNICVKCVPMKGYECVMVFTASGNHYIGKMEIG